MRQMSENEAPTAGTPRWVKVFAIIALLAAVLVVVLLLTGRDGSHSPRRHAAPADLTPAGATGAHPSAATHTEPRG